MRSKFVAAAMACLALAACGGPQTSQANNAQANIDNNAAPPPTANASNAMVLLAVPWPKDRALALMKERHEGMESIGDAFKALHRDLGGTPDLATVRGNAAKIAGLSRAASRWFPAGTGPDVAKTRALPQIW